MQNLGDRAGTSLDSSVESVSFADSGAMQASGSHPTRDAIEAALKRESGNIAAAARSLGLHRTQLYRLMKRHGITPGTQT